MEFRTIAGYLTAASMTVRPIIATDSPDQQRDKIRKMASSALKFVRTFGRGSEALAAELRTLPSGS